MSNTITGLKLCRKCGLEKPLNLEHFYLRYQGKKAGKFRPTCRACENAYGRSYVRGGWPEDPAAVDVASQRREKKAARMRAWRENNREKALAQRKASRQRRRALERNAEGDFTPEQWQEKARAYGGKCHWCQTDIEGTPHADHVIPLSRGGSNYIDNIVPSCRKCNLEKASRLPSEWR